MVKDIEVASKVGAKGLLVKTGYGANTIRKYLTAGSPKSYRPYYIAEDILDAVKWIMNDRKTKKKESLEKMIGKSLRG
jgi:ribonucleotide monophosphatase NagD (HAD superfamily)